MQCFIQRAPKNKLSKQGNSADNFAQLVVAKTTSIAVDFAKANEPYCAALLRTKLVNEGQMTTK